MVQCFVFLFFIRNQSYKLITHVFNPFTKHVLFVLEYSYLCARCGLKLQTGDTKGKIKCSSFPSTDERAFKWAFKSDGAHLHRCEQWIGCLEEEPIPGAVDFTLAFSVTEETWAYSQQLNYFRTLSGSFGCAN